MAVTNRDMANAIRALSMDAVEAAKSGHVGLPLGMADAADPFRCVAPPISRIPLTFLIHHS